LSLKLSDTRVYEPQIRARLGTTAHFCNDIYHPGRSHAPNAKHTTGWALNDIYYSGIEGDDDMFADMRVQLRAAADEVMRRAQRRHAGRTKALQVCSHVTAFEPVDCLRANKRTQLTA